MGKKRKIWLKINRRVLKFIDILYKNIIAKINIAKNTSKADLVNVNKIFTYVIVDAINNNIVINLFFDLQNSLRTKTLHSRYFIRFFKVFRL